MQSECLYGDCLGVTVSSVTVVEMESFPRSHADVNVLMILKSSQLQSYRMWI